MRRYGTGTVPVLVWHYYYKAKMVSPHLQDLLAVLDFMYQVQVQKSLLGIIILYEPLQTCHGRERFRRGAGYRN